MGPSMLDGSLLLLTVCLSLTTHHPPYTPVPFAKFQIRPDQLVQHSHLITSFHNAQFGMMTSLIFKNGNFVLKTRLYFARCNQRIVKKNRPAHTDQQMPQIQTNGYRSAIPQPITRSVGYFSG